MRYIGSHFVFAYILNYSTLRKFQFSVWSSAMPKEVESIKKKLNTSKQGKDPNLGLAAVLYAPIWKLSDINLRYARICVDAVAQIVFFLQNAISSLPSSVFAKKNFC